MAYNNPFLYNKDSSVDNSIYSYVEDLTYFKPIYGSSVNYTSRLNYIETVDNALKVMPSSENNLSIKYNLKFVLNNLDAGSLLKTIETAGGYRYLKFKDPSLFYESIVGLVEDYNINKNSNNSNEFSLTVSSYFKSPLFKWRTSSLFNVNSILTDYNPRIAYKKHDFVYFDVYNFTRNKIDNFWFAKEDIDVVFDETYYLTANPDVAADAAYKTKPLNHYIDFGMREKRKPKASASPGAPYFDLTKWTKNFNHDLKLPFELKNNFDIYQTSYKNSFIENLKHKDNSNALKQFNLKLENISDLECKSALFFLEKKCGYRRFIYEFPFFLIKNKVFICINWVHTFKYLDCHDITMTFVEDPNPNIYIDNNIFTYNDKTTLSNTFYYVI